MTTDNKTLADVQPGGRVRLGDQAERARFEAWPQAREFEIQKDGSGEYLSEVTHGAWLAWKYLSAQPSPGGQDALAAINRVVEQLEDMERSCRIHPDYLDDARVAQAALAARQPVGEPVAYIEHFADKVSRMAMTMTGLHLGIGRHPVYAAPPAQAVDLGQLPRAVELLSNVSRTLVDWAADEQREAIGIVKALIDNHSAGGQP